MDEWQWLASVWLNFDLNQVEKYLNSKKSRQISWKQIKREQKQQLNNFLSDPDFG